MKKIIKVILSSLLIFMSIPTSSVAGAKKGQRIYKKYFHKKCGFSGVTFARHHLQEEWEEIYETDRLLDEAKHICPHLDTEKIKKEWWKDLYLYSVKYAKDGVPPNGCDD